MGLLIGTVAEMITAATVSAKRMQAYQEKIQVQRGEDPGFSTVTACTPVLLDKAVIMCSLPVILKAQLTLEQHALESGNKAHTQLALRKKLSMTLLQFLSLCRLILLCPRIHTWNPSNKRSTTPNTFQRDTSGR